MAWNIPELMEPDVLRLQAACHVGLRSHAATQLASAASALSGRACLVGKAWKACAMSPTIAARHRRVVVSCMRSDPQLGAAEAAAEGSAPVRPQAWPPWPKFRRLRCLHGQAIFDGLKPTELTLL